MLCSNKNLEYYSLPLSIDLVSSSTHLTLPIETRMNSLPFHLLPWIIARNTKKQTLTQFPPRCELIEWKWHLRSNTHTHMQMISSIYIISKISTIRLMRWFIVPERNSTNFGISFDVLFTDVENMWVNMIIGMVHPNTFFSRNQEVQANLHSTEL